VPFFCLILIAPPTQGTAAQLINDKMGYKRKNRTID